MRRWWKKLGAMVAGLLAWTGSAAHTPAQGPAPFGGGPLGQAVYPGAGPLIPPNPVSPLAGGQINPAVKDLTLSANTLGSAFDETRYVDYCINEPYTWAFRFEYLNWGVSKGHLPVPLLTTSRSPVLNENSGALGNLNTRILYGPGRYSAGQLPGGRVTLGLSPHFMPPVEFTGMFLNRDSTLVDRGESTRVLLTRPVQFFDRLVAPNIGRESVEFVNVPGAITGRIRINSNVNLWTFDINWFLPLCETDCIRIDGILGWRHAELRDVFSIRNDLGNGTTDSGVNFGGTLNFPRGFTTTVIDRYRAFNRFDGGNIGFRGSLNLFWRISLLQELKIALGTTRQEIEVAGFSSLFNVEPTRPTQTLDGGIYNLTSNSGTQVRRVFTAIPEYNLTVNCQLHRNMRFFVGYNFFYWTAVSRASDHINSIVNSRLIPTDSNYAPDLANPSFPARTQIRTRDFYGHGINLGIEIGF